MKNVTLGLNAFFYDAMQVLIIFFLAIILREWSRLSNDW